MIEQGLWIVGSFIFLLFGSMHLYLTFFTDRFSPKNENTMTEMKSTYPLLSNETTMWKAWIGFNASHSAGAIFFGAINIILASLYFSLLRNSIIILALNLLFSIFFMILAKKYWFKIPFTGTMIASICFIISVIIILFN